MNIGESLLEASRPNEAARRHRIASFNKNRAKFTWRIYTEIQKLPPGLTCSEMGKELAKKGILSTKGKVLISSQISKIIQSVEEY